MAILVTGGTGFIGSRLVDRLVKQGDTVHVLDITVGNVEGDGVEGARYFTGDIMNPGDVERAMTGCDRIYHLAAYAKNWAPDDRTFFDVNVGGAKVVLETALKLKVARVVHTSSNVALGPSNGVQIEETSQRTKDFFTPYEHSKFLSERLVERYAQRGLDVVIVNPTRVFGPGPLNESNSVTKMISWYLSGRWRFVLGDGKMVGNYVYVKDLIEGYIGAMKFGKAGERYILGGENISFDGFFGMLSKVSGRYFRMVHLPSRLAMYFSQLEEFRSRHFHHYPLITPGWARTFLSDWANSCGKAQRELGYSITPLSQALKETIDWLSEATGAKGLPAVGR